MEHLNGRLKTLLQNQGANIKANAVEKAGKSIGVVHTVCKVFEQQTSSSRMSDSHSYPAYGKDYTTVLKVLQEEDVFTTSSER